MKNKTKACIIMLSWNTKELTRDCLDSIRNNTIEKNFKIVMVDSGSKDGSQEMIKKHYPEVDLFELKENKGFSGGNNICIKHAYKKYNPDYYYFLSNDTKVTKGWLKNILEFADTHPEGGMFGSRQRDFNDKQVIYAAYINKIGIHKYISPQKPQEVTWVSGGSFMVKKNVIKKIGAFDEIFNPSYYEESDWEERAIRSGFKVYIVPSSLIYHKGSGSIDSYTYSRNEMFYRKRLIFYVKHYKRYLITRIFIDFFRGIMIGELKTVSRGYMQGVKDLLNNKSKKMKTVYIK
jgi:GT2 family glycosyltransferase